MRRVAVLLVLVVGAFAGQAAAAPAPYLVKDLNTVGRGTGASSPAAAGGSLFFAGDDGQTGKELWKSDGTAAGTVQIADLVPGPDGSDPSQLDGRGGVLFFTAAVSKDSRAVWRSDGTAAGTWQVSQGFVRISNDPFEPNPRTLVPVGSAVYFSAYDDTSGWQLWRSDGARLDASPVGGIPADTLPDAVTEANGAIYFTARVGVGESSSGLWTTAGSPDEARILFAPEAGYVTGPLRVVGNGIYFAADEGAGYGLYHLDLAGGVPERLSDDPTAYYSGSAIFHGELHFVVGGNALWKSDGTRAGTRQVVTLSVPFFGAINGLITSGDFLFFTADDGVAGRELWRSDGVTAERFLDVYPGSGSSNPYWLTDVNGTLFFLVGHGITGEEVWRSDGTSAGTIRVASMSAGSLTPLGPRLFFAGVDGSGEELWVSDGTVQGTHQVIDLLHYTQSADPVAMIDAGGTLYLVGQSDDGMSLWRSDGTAAGTTVVTEASASIDWTEYAPLAAVGSTVFFAGPGQVQFRSALWRTDGTSAGSRPLLELAQSGSYGLFEFTPFDGALYFSTTDPVTGQELWRSDGTVRQTIELADLNPGPSGSVAWLAVMNDKLYFAASDGVTGAELWQSDGTGPGMAQVADINPGWGGSYPSSLTVVGDTLFFVAAHSNDQSDVSLWKSDGTAGGTVPVMRFGYDWVRFPMAVDRLLFFRVDVGSLAQLWRSDGSEAGTIKLAEFPDTRGPLPLAALHGKLVFTADDGVIGRELWTSDGTAAGTAPLVDLLPGRRGSNPQFPQAIGDQLYFSADDGVSGREPWVSDGSAAGTRQLADLQPGLVSSNAGLFTHSGDFLFFAANDRAVGRELWALLIGCGDGAPDPGEECDDGNRVDGDGCSARCVRECIAASDCADADPCTTDACVAGTCRSETLRDYDGAVCRVEEMLGGSPCDDGPVSPRLRFTARLARVKELLGEAEESRGTRRKRKLLRRADGLLRRLEREADRLRDADRMSEACAANITAAVAARRAEVAALMPPSKTPRRR